MIHEDGANGVYLFGFDKLEDSEGLGDDWFETVADADAAAAQKYNVTATDWQLISDPLEHCQQDWIAPVRVKGRPEGNAQWGQLEKRVNGQWVEFYPE
ncbi:hypothetical protein [Hymenobacter lucidus]|uniref:Uncharacterized protein n=1 Tax=Hymenobacter lucidus TaxID=2880930 RepID=A0ABS8AJQ1_9BACT|nr:hypothetical protein [Hymenobacter lucidus]MCB2406435.1 hypothetical protein [Hymenobacter lucidus]